ncbi:hypothetical protein ACWKSP_10625 [Micromonosporaceae bacterium Da 78-11]
MRRLVFPIIVGIGLVMAGPSGAFADPAPVVSVQATPGKKVCKVTDPKLDEISGLVGTKDGGFVVIDDSTEVDAKRKVFFLNNKCKITSTQDFASRPIDPEDVILSPDGATLWIADTGDNGVRDATPTHRPSVALWTMKADGSKEATIHRLTYPDGDYHDAEALLLNGDGTPLIITKELGKAAGIYAPSTPLKADNKVGVPMKKVGEITVSATETPGNPVARIGNRTITGGAVAPGGGKVVLRTYTDAFEWHVTGGDVLGALKQKPRTTGLPNETFGEAISYSPDGKSFLTVSDMNGDVESANNIAQYEPATTLAVEKKASESTVGGAKKSWYSDLSINDITYMIGGIGIIGLILVGAGVLGIVRSRKRTQGTQVGGLGGLDDSRNDDPETELIGVGGLPQRAGMYGAAGAARPGGAPAGGSAAMYGGGVGGPAAAGQRGTGVYGGPGGQGGVSSAGGQGGGGPQYGRPGAGGQQPPARPGQPPVRGGQTPARAGQQPPARAGQQPPARGGQPPARNGVYGPPAGNPQGQPPRGPQQGQPRPQGPAPQGQQRPPQGQGQRPPQGQSGAPGQGGMRPPQGQAQRPQGPGQRPAGPAQRPQGPGQRPQGGYPQGDGRQQRGGDERGDQNGRPDGHYDNPGYGRR